MRRAGGRGSTVKRVRKCKYPLRLRTDAPDTLQHDSTRIVIVPRDASQGGMTAAAAPARSCMHLAGVSWRCKGVVVGRRLQLRPGDCAPRDSTCCDAVLFVSARDAHPARAHVAYARDPRLLGHSGLSALGANTARGSPQCMYAARQPGDAYTVSLAHCLISSS